MSKARDMTRLRHLIKKAKEQLDNLSVMLTFKNELTLEDCDEALTKTRIIENHMIDARMILDFLGEEED